MDVPASPTWIASARVPAVLLDTAAPGRVDEDGLALADLRLESGRIAGMAPCGTATGDGIIDLDGGQCWPCFLDLHAHLDKGHIWPRAANRDGSIETARATTRADTLAHWNAEDIAARFDFALRCAYAHGTAAIRTHLDCLVPGQAAVAFGVFGAMRDRWAGRIALQAAALVPMDIYERDEGVMLADLVATSGGMLGGIARRIRQDDDPAVLDAQLDRLLRVATERGLDVDLHVDENGDPESRALAQVARAVLRNRFRGRVNCGHCCSLAVQPDPAAGDTMALAREAKLSVVSLPMINLFLQGRMAGRTPRWRGVTLLRELREAGVPVSVASDNCRDPYFAFGDLDMLEVFREAVRIAHLDVDVAAWPAAVTRTPADVMGLPERGIIRVGAPADLVLFRGRGMSELLARPQSDRIVLRGGRRIEAVLPDYRELDPLFRTASR